MVIAACGDGAVSAQSLRAYLAAVEPIRLSVNTLLESADPVLDAYRTREISGPQAAEMMGRIESKFATYTLQINSLTPDDARVAAMNAPYAHTYILEDAYLNALVAGLAGGDLSNLPTTQSQQRAAIIEWRIQLEAMAGAAGMTVPADLQQAGRGEIAPGIGDTG